MPNARRMRLIADGHSKKWENHEAALGLFFAYYNYARVHSTIKSTPAVAAGLADHTWSLAELLAAAARARQRRGGQVNPALRAAHHGFVMLPGGRLDGPQRRNLRRVWRKAVDEGCSFEVVRGEELRGQDSIDVRDVGNGQ